MSAQPKGPFYVRWKFTGKGDREDVIRNFSTYEKAMTAANDFDEGKGSMAKKLDRAHWEAFVGRKPKKLETKPTFFPPERTRLAGSSFASEARRYKG